MADPDGTRALMKYYIVRVYRRVYDAVQRQPQLIGLVETSEGETQAFHTMEELWRILLEKTEGGPP